MKTTTKAILAMAVLALAAAVIVIPADASDASDDRVLNISDIQYDSGMIAVFVDKNVENAQFTVSIDGVQQTSLAMGQALGTGYAIIITAEVSEIPQTFVLKNSNYDDLTFTYPAAPATEYTITWIVDGVETTESVAYGETPVFTGSTDKAADAQYTYTFAGWNPEITAVTEDATYTAIYDETVNKYDVVWTVDGEIFASQTLDYGADIVAPEAVPEKDADVQYTYTFASWNGYTEGMTVTGAVEFTAVFDMTVNMYTVTWIVEDVETQTQVAYGEAPAYDGTPAKDSDDRYNYVFIGWAPELVAVTGDATYTAVFEAEPIDPAKRTFNNTITLGDGAIIDSASAIIASYTQEVVISGDVTVVEGGYMIISGKLTVAEGAVLTIETGGKVTIAQYGIVDVKGDLVIEGSDDGYSFTYNGIVMNVSGEVDLEGADSFLSQGEGIEISGLFVVGDDATAQLDGATIAKGGKLLVNGVAYGEIINNGDVTIDSQGLEDGTSTFLIINLGAEGVVDIVNVYGVVGVTDENLQFTQGKNTYDAKHDNAVGFGNVSGVKITETLVISEKDGVYTGKNTMNIAGTIVTAVDYNASVENGIVVIDGDNVATSGDVVLGDNITMEIDGKVTVTAALNAINDGSKIIGAGEMTVDGKVTVKTAVPETLKVNAARYTTASPAYVIYTTLETALADGATTIALMGENTVAADAIIPVGTTVTMDAGSKLTVSDKATLTIAADERNSARFNTAGVDTVDVKGTLVVVNFAKSKIAEASILSDTAKTVDKTRTYTNIYNALAAASEGETVEITRGADLLLKKDVEVKKGITLSIPADEKVVVDNGVTVTVNGTVYVAGDYEIKDEIPDDVNTAADESKPAGATVVNGLFLYTDDNADYTEDIVGAYFDYSYTVGKSTVVVNAIAPLASMPAIMDKVESECINLYGEMAVGAVDFSAYEGDVVSIHIFDKFNFDSITLGSSVELSSYEGAVTGTIVLANGSVDVKNVYGFIAYNETDADEVTTSYFGDYVVAYDNPETTTVVEKGSVSFTGAVTIEIDTTENVAVDVPADATVTVIGGEYDGAVTVEGAVVINGTEIVFQDLTVTGAVTAEKNKVAKAVKLFVGVTSEDFAKAGTGSVEGVTLVNSASAVAYVSPNATVGEDITELKSTAYYVEDAPYLTAYAVAGNNVKIGGIKFTVQNAWFDAWTYTSDDRTIEVTAQVIGDADKVYADIVYDIFNVKVIVDSGIGAVAIDGNVLVNEAGNVFVTTAPLKAGQHTVTYTLKSGYTGTAKLSVNGEGATVSGNNFTLAGTPESAQGIEVQLSLFGTEVADPSITIDVPTQPTDKDEGLGLTDILLIILVILAAILVIVVAIRMMRS